MQNLHFSQPVLSTIIFVVLPWSWVFYVVSSCWFRLKIGVSIHGRTDSWPLIYKHRYTSAGFQWSVITEKMLWRCTEEGNHILLLSLVEFWDVEKKTITGWKKVKKLRGKLCKEILCFVVLSTGYDGCSCRVDKRGNYWNSFITLLLNWRLCSSLCCRCKVPLFFYGIKECSIQAILSWGFLALFTMCWELSVAANLLNSIEYDLSNNPWVTNMWSYYQAGHIKGFLSWKNEWHLIFRLKESWCSNKWVLRQCCTLHVVMHSYSLSWKNYAGFIAVFTEWGQCHLHFKRQWILIQPTCPSHSECHLCLCKYSVLFQFHHIFHQIMCRSALLCIYLNESYNVFHYFANISLYFVKETVGFNKDIYPENTISFMTPCSWRFES